MFYYYLWFFALLCIGLGLITVVQRISTELAMAMFLVTVLMLLNSLQVTIESTADRPFPVDFVAGGFAIAGALAGHLSARHLAKGHVPTEGRVNMLLSTLMPLPSIIAAAIYVRDLVQY
jgi:hypothetical protein